MHYNQDNMGEKKMPQEEDRRRNERDLVLSPNEFAFIADETKGNVDVYTGPHKTSLANTDQPVIFDAKLKRFRRTSLEQSIQCSATAPEGWYLVLKNPSKNPEEIHPKKGSRSQLPNLDVGRKINIPGPISFALWPGQMVKVLQGHHIRSNQYLLVRIYDEEAAKANWEKTVIKSKNEDQTPDLVSGVPSDLAMGNLYIIRGTEVSFYIPPTGVEVVPEPGTNSLIRDAVTLERLEYCLLKDESGNKRYVRGPAVVFPRPTEIFIEKPVNRDDSNSEKTKKFKAIELNETSGLYVKVIADYEESGKKYKIGDELFITGKDQMIYFPREEHAIIKYGDREIHYGIAIPEGEARYVLDRNNGEITLVKGPQVFLPDPRNQVVVRRVLERKVCELLYPGNAVALEHNVGLLGIEPDAATGAVLYNMVGPAAATAAVLNEVSEYSRGVTTDMLRSRVAMTKGAAKGFEGDAFDRKGQFTAPRTLTLNTKFDGAVSVDIWSGYAVMLVRKSGERRVVVGPRTALLEYDETPQILTLSTGKPKTTDNLYQTAYLCVTANKVSDIIACETKDFCKLNIKVSYRLNFVGDDPQKWFTVDNYVKYFTDHLRSKLRNEVMRFGVEEFYTNAVSIVRDIILGPAEDGKKRVGALFEENNMHIYDVDVLGLTLEDNKVQESLIAAQRNLISQSLVLNSEKAKLEYTKQIESIARETQSAKFETEQTLSILKEKRTALLLEGVAHDSKVKAAQLESDLNVEKAMSVIYEEKQSRTRNDALELLKREEEAMRQRITMLNAEAEALTKRAAAVSPEFISALQSFGDKEMIERVAEAMAPMSIIGGESVVDSLQKLLAGSPLGDKLKSFVNQQK